MLLVAWVTIHNILQLTNSPFQKVKSSAAALSRKSFQKGWIFHMRHIKAFHWSTLTWRKGIKHYRLINRMIHKLQTGILALLSNTALVLSTEG